MNAIRQVPSILTSIVLVLVGLPASLLAADGYTTQCGSGASCTAAHSAAISGCTAAGGSALRMVGPCSDSGGQKRQCITCKGPDQPSQSSEPRPGAGAPSMPQASTAAPSCEQAAQALRNAIDGCGNRSQCLVNVSRPDGGVEALSMENARARAAQLEQQAAALARVDALRNQVDQGMAAFRERMRAMQANAAEQGQIGARNDSFIPSAVSERAKQQAVDWLVDKAIDKTVQKAALAPMSQPMLSPEEAIDGIKQLKARLGSVKSFSELEGSPEILNSLSQLIAGGAGTESGRQQLAGLLKDTLKTGMDVGGNTADQLNAAKSLLEKLLPPSVVAEFKVAELAIDAWLAAAEVGLDVQLAGDLSRLAEGNLMDIKIRAERMKDDVAALKTARQSLAGLGPCEPVARAEARLPETPKEVAKKKGPGAVGKVATVVALAGGVAALVVGAQELKNAQDAVASGGGGGGGGSGVRAYDGTYDFLFVFTTPGGDSSRTLSRFFRVSNGTISSTDGTVRGSLTSSGAATFIGPCPINNDPADYTGTLSTNGTGQGTYRCRTGGISRSWRVFNRA